ncbi:hypothetical protein RUND412_010194 [Rhizina undulata]
MSCSLMMAVVSKPRNPRAIVIAAIETPVLSLPCSLKRSSSSASGEEEYAEYAFSRSLDIFEPELLEQEEPLEDEPLKEESLEEVLFRKNTWGRDLRIWQPWNRNSQRQRGPEPMEIGELMVK